MLSHGILGLGFDREVHWQAELLLALCAVAIARSITLQENPMTKRLVLVAGNIASGKTSLTERLGARLGWHTAFESVADNPYLADFYADMSQWSFHLQVFFLGHRAQQHLDLANAPESAIADRSIYEDAHIFARALYHLGNLTERDYHSYRQVFDQVVAHLPPPDLLLHLQAPVPVLLDRIGRRGRAIEGGITADYLSLLEMFYGEWLQAFDLCPVITIRTDDLDFVHKPRHLDIVIQRIQDRLAGHEEVVFPVDSNAV
jgi:deoxyadenosine/deoxycytidine kinase